MELVPSACRYPIVALDEDLLPAPGNPVADSQLGIIAADLPHPAANALYALSIGSNDLTTIFTLDCSNPAQAIADATAVLGNIGIPACRPASSPLVPIRTNTCSGTTSSRPKPASA